MIFSFAYLQKNIVAAKPSDVGPIVIVKSSLAFVDVRMDHVNWFSDTR